MFNINVSAGVSQSSVTGELSKTSRVEEERFWLTALKTLVHNLLDPLLWTWSEATHPDISV